MRILIMLLLSLCSTMQAQSQPYKNLVFEGAGIRGIAYSGVIRELEKAGVMDEIIRVGGTSAGAITALAISLGYDSDELYQLISETNFRKFNDGRFTRLNSRFGIFKGDEFRHWLEGIVEEKTGDGSITFAQLSAQGYKDLYVTATCLNKQELIVFSSVTYPNMKVIDAVRISMSVPLYFEAIFIDREGNVYNKPGKRKDLDIVVDGGIIGNFPIFIFDSTTYDEYGHSTRIPNPQTIGVRIDSETQIAADKRDQELVDMEIENLKDYVEAFYVLVIESLNREQLIPEDWGRTISVSSEGIGPRIKKLSQDQKQKLIKSGEHYTRRFLYSEGLE